MAFPFSKREREPDIELPPLPTTAIVERTNGKVELPDMDGQQFDEMERVGIYAKQARGKLRETQIQLTETTLRLESARRENSELRLGIAQSQNDRQTLQAQIEDLRQEVAGLRAAISTYYQVVVSFVSTLTLQLQRARIQLPPVWDPMRQNQPTNEVPNVSTLEPIIDRPASGSDQGAGPTDPPA